MANPDTTDTKRLDEIERRGLSVECIWGQNPDWAGGVAWLVGRNRSTGYQPGDTLREAIDRALEQKESQRG